MIASMQTFSFTEKNGSGFLIFSAEDYTKALNYLKEIVKYPNEWIVENEEGEDEDEILPF